VLWEEFGCGAAIGGRRAYSTDLDNTNQSMILCFYIRHLQMTSKKEFTFAELQKVTSLGRGEIRECINRGIISAPAGVGQGHHRSYNKWNLVEGVIVAALLRQVRAGAVAQIMKNLRAVLVHLQIEPESYCEMPSEFIYEAIFPPRTDPDERADLTSGEEMGEGAYLLGTATRQPHHGPPLTRGTPLAAFCKLPIDLEQAVRFASHMIETRL